jgi:hypothetical protein
MICKTCGALGRPIKKFKGSFFIEIILWLCLLVPGLLYSIWRHTSKYNACPACDNPTMIPVDTAVGNRLFTEYYPNKDIDG